LASILGLAALVTTVADRHARPDPLGSALRQRRVDHRGLAGALGTPIQRGVALALLVVLPIAACTRTARATCQPRGTELHVVAENHSFGTNCLAAPADQAFTIAFRNEDTSPHGAHNITIYREEGGVVVFTGKGLLPGGTSVVYEVQPLAGGTYSFRCDTHLFMEGTFIVG